MNAMERFTKLKAMKEDLLHYKWSAEGAIWDGLRLFYDSAGRTSEHSLSKEEKTLCLEAMRGVRYSGADISYNPHSVIADGMRKVLRDYCDAEMKKLAKIAEKEAKDVLEQLS